MFKSIPKFISASSHRRRVVATASGVLACAAVGAGTYQITSANASATTSSAPSAISTSASTPATPGTASPTSRRNMILNRAVHASIELYNKKAGQLVTVTIDRGKLVTASSGSITISELGNGNITDQISPNTRFVGLTLAQLEANPSARVFLISKDGTLSAVRSKAIDPKAAAPSTPANQGTPSTQGTQTA